MTWQEIKPDIIKSLNNRGLANPRIRINALSKIEGYLLQDVYLKTIISKPSLLNTITKSDFKAKVAQQKDTGVLNGAEKSVINEIYYRILN